VRGVQVPGRGGPAQGPCAVIVDRVRGFVQQGAVERLDRGIAFLCGPAAQLDRQPDRGPLKLALVQQRATRQGGDQRGGGQLPLRAEGARGALFVVILDETQHVVLIAAIGAQMRHNRAHGLALQPVAKPLVIRIVEALLQQIPFHVPIHFGDEQRVGVMVFDRRDHHRPEFQRGRMAGAFAPGLGKNPVGDQHRHVAANAVALGRDVAQRLDHLGAHGGVEGVELGGVGPDREIGIAPVGEYLVMAGGWSQKEVIGLAVHVLARAVDETLGVGFQPGMVHGDVVGHEVQHQPQSARGQPLAQGRQLVAPAEVRIDLVAVDGIGRADDILRRKVGQGAAIFSLKVRVFLGDDAPGRAALPHTHQPNGVETPGCQRVQVGIRHAAQRDRPPVNPAERVQPGPGVDLVNQGVVAPGGVHVPPS